MELYLRLISHGFCPVNTSSSSATKRTNTILIIIPLQNYDCIGTNHSCSINNRFSHHLLFIYGSIAS